MEDCQCRAYPQKGSKDDIKNYRPISLTSLVMKTFERILKDELLIRTSHLLDCRQNGFLNFKSCTTNMVNFTDKLVLSINDTQTLSTDVIYFDFSKAFDSVNHDLILHNMKYEYAIGSLLKFLMNYLGEREHCKHNTLKQSFSFFKYFSCFSRFFLPITRKRSILVPILLP